MLWLGWHNFGLSGSKYKFYESNGNGEYNYHRIILDGKEKTSISSALAVRRITELNPFKTNQNNMLAFILIVAGVACFALFYKLIDFFEKI